ncbi:DUF4386 domain-containing protein [Marinibacterium profundimaris]|nr:DUF4386 domain-containing protein [Marinibacterium profundimaris]
MPASLPASPASPAPRPRPGARPMARLAGALYLLIIGTGLSAEFALRGPLLASPSPLANIAAAAPAFRLSLLGDLVMLLADVTLALLFFQLLRGVSAPLALAAMVFRLMQAALIGMGLILLSQVPVLADQPGLATAILGIHATGYDVALVFFGVNSALLALLLHRGGAVPRILVLAMGGSAAVYVSGGVLRLVAPELSDALLPAYLLPLLAETGLALWLVIRGRV